MRDTPTQRDFCARVRRGEPKALSEFISLLDDGNAEGFRILRALWPKATKPYVVGVTGSAGVGKSSLIGALLGHLAQRPKQLAILLTDPTSPATGGAFLGDRLRLPAEAARSVFVRSMATRGGVGGLAKATLHAIRALACAGKKTIILETVGIGQDEVEVRRVANTVVLVLSPGDGDEIQAMKAGVMEIADIYVVNKSDTQETNGLVEFICSNVAKPRAGWKPPVCATSALTGSGIEELYEKIKTHRRFLSRRIRR